MIVIEQEKKIQKGPDKWSWATRGRRYGAEALGVFAIVFVAGGSAVTSQSFNSQTGLVGAALAAGLTVMAMIYALGHICGAHFNPAVTVAFMVSRHFPIREVPGYMLAQLTGASLAALFLKGLFGSAIRASVTIPAGNPGQALLMEIVTSFFLMVVIISVATDTRATGQAAAIAIGVTVTAAILVAGPVSGASMNPARSFGPALLSGTWQDFWVYWLGPITGTVLGAGAYQLLRGNERSYQHER